VTDCPLDAFAAIALWAFRHVAVVLLDAHVGGELLLAVLTEKIIVGHGLDLLG
jgi:hypothetical protein